MTNPLYAQDFSFWQMALAFVFIAVAWGLSKTLKLRLENDVLINALRTTLQLLGVGYVLHWILKSDSLWGNLLIFLVMSLIAAQAVTSRAKNKSLKLYGAALLTLLLSVWPLGLSAMAIFFHPKSLQQSAFFIPFVGVLMGNALSAISLTFVGLERVRSENILEIETFKALGANSFEACERIYRDILRASLTPQLNAMAIVGVVSLPGIMAGQLLGGVNPVTAARFQIVVMFLLLLMAMVGGLIAVLINHFYFMPAWLNAKATTWSFANEYPSKMSLSGPSGTGKSRLLKSLVVLDDLSIRDNIQKTSSVKFCEVNSQDTQYLHQKAFFIPGTVEDNLRLPLTFKSHANKNFDRIKIETYLNQLGLNKEFLQKSATSLSGGEGQLIHLIRSLQLEPKVLFLDEPTSSLDQNKTLLVERLLDQWVHNQHHLVIITHNKEQIHRFAPSALLLTEQGLSLGPK